MDDLKPKVLPLSDVNAFIAQHKSFELATLNQQGLPEVSYTPFIRQGDEFYIFVSDLAKHAANLRRNPVVAAMCIESESDAQQIYARQRCILQCDVIEQHALSDEAKASILNEFEACHGAIIKMLRSLPDFNLFKLIPTEITLVKGFGQAYRGHPLQMGEWPESFKQLTSA